MTYKRTMNYFNNIVLAHFLLSLQQQQDSEPIADEIPPPAALPEDIVHRSTSGVTHRLTPLVNEKTSQYARYIFEPVDSNMWSVVHEEGEMKVYRRELEEDGVVIDPLRANYTVSVSEGGERFWERG